MKNNDERILSALIGNKTIGAAAVAAGVSERTIYSRLAVIQEIAREQNCVTHNFTAMSTDGLPASAAETAIRTLQGACADILASSVTRAARIASEYHARNYGAKDAPDDLPQEKPYSSERDFYERAMPWTPYEAFAKAVNE